MQQQENAHAPVDAGAIVKTKGHGRVEPILLPLVPGKRVQMRMCSYTLRKLNEGGDRNPLPIIESYARSLYL